MSLTSYRAAPSRATIRLPCGSLKLTEPPRRHANVLPERLLCEWVFYLCPPAAKPGDDLLFHCLSNSTIGAVWFHGRVRDGIGWVTDAMITKL